MIITKFFNPYNVDHIKAYKNLMITGMWPDGFLPEDIDYDPQWQVTIQAKMASCWVDAAHAGHIFGMPDVDQ